MLAIHLAPEAKIDLLSREIGAKLEPSLKFVEEPYPLRHLGNLLAQFRAKGFVVLPNVFERDSVDGFRQEVEATVVKNPGGRLELPEDRPELVYPLRAPRIRAPLCGALSPSQIATKASVFETAWLISQSGVMTDDWHKDRQHDVGMPGQEYHYPLGVHLRIYYRDMEDIEDGPTAVVPSHQNQSLNSYNGSAQELFLARQEDVVRWDQRLWHQAWLLCSTSISRISNTSNGKSFSPSLDRIKGYSR